MTHLNLTLSISHSPLHVVQSSVGVKTGDPPQGDASTNMASFFGLEWPWATMMDNKNHKPPVVDFFVVQQHGPKEPNLSLMQMLYNFLKRYIWMRFLFLKRYQGSIFENAIFPNSETHTPVGSKDQQCQRCGI